MSRVSTDRVKLNPPLGRMPALQFILPSELAVDDSYQRSVTGGDSQALIKRIAQHWNWDLCQPLVVSRRVGSGALFVIDGQHRLAAAQLRGDIAQLPCVIVEYASAADEAASFVQLNQLRRPLSRLDVFRAAVASGDQVALGIVDALAAFELKLARHGNVAAMGPGEVASIGSIEATWRKQGEGVAYTAIGVVAGAFGDQVLRYVGTIWPGIVGVCETEIARPGGFTEAKFQQFCAMLKARPQDKWRSLVLTLRAEHPELGMNRAAARVVQLAWDTCLYQTGAPVPTESSLAPVQIGKAGWCEQCEARVTAEAAGACASKFCKMKVAA